MGRVVVVVILVVALLATAGVAIADAPDEEPAGDTVAPGERMVGVLGVQHAELDGEIAHRNLGISVANAGSDDEVADVVAIRLAELDTRLDAIERELDELEAKRAAGNLSPGQYQAEVATLEAERAAAARLANGSAAVANDLPAEVRANHGIQPEHVDALGERAQTLTGPEVAAIAREIAGPDVGAGPTDRGVDPVPDDAGPPAHANVTEPGR